MSICLHLLGRPRVEHDGATVALPAERRCQLLALLALRRGWVARAELAALFWPGQQPVLAATNLRKALHFARALPWAAALETQGSAVRFVVVTDVHEVEQAMREGRIEAALERCRGDLLDGMDDLSMAAWTDWLDAERAQHARRRHELTRARLAQLQAEPQQAAAFARRLLDADPLDEDAVVALLAAQRALGAFDEQREVYRSFALRLEEELGVEPSQRVASQLRSMAAVPADGFIGRARELDELATLLARDECRLLTVAGPGGVGKSSLLKHALKELGARFADGALWIALDDLTDTAQAAARIAAELKLTPAAQQDPLAIVCEQLKPRQLLLVLDNAEHLAGLPRLVGRLLDAAPSLKICATSRVRLGAAGERLLPLHGLALPPAQAGSNELLACDAARLFVAGAVAAQPDFDARAQAVAIGELVHAVGGLPLAILLAAHWVRLLPVAEIGAELERSLDVLDSGDDGEERPEHRSMRATFERSWQMLATREQQVLAALSVFVGTFSRDAAQQVAGAALPLLAALADKSLLQMPAGGRCSLHPLIRQFAAGKLAADGAVVAARRHADWYLTLLARLGRSIEAGEPSAFDAIDTELENFRQAWRWAVAEAATERIAATAGVLMRFFELRGRTAEGLALLREAQPVVGSGAAAGPAAAAVAAAVAHLQFRLYRLDDAAASARQGLRAARVAGGRNALWLCLNVLGICHWQWGRNVEARRFFEQALRHARAGHHPSGASAVLSNLAGVENALGNREAARCLMAEALAQQREAGDWVRVASLLNNLAALHQALCEWSQAGDCLDEAVALSERHGIAQVRPHLLINQAVVRFFSGEVDAAERAAQQAIDVARTMANRAVEAQALLHLVRIAVRRGDCIAARERLGAAIDFAACQGYALIRLDFVLVFATLLAAEGDAPGAAALLRYCLAQPDIEPADVQTARSVLDGLPADAVATPPPSIGLDELVARIARQLQPG